jgi:hypothetical protein
MSYKSDVKPVTLSANGIFFAGRTRLRGFLAQPTTPGSTGVASINTLVSGATTSATTTSGYYIPIIVGASGSENVYIPEDGVLYENGIGATSITNMTLTVFIDK